MRKKNKKYGNNKRGIGKVVSGLVVGSVVGAAVGLLMAPTSGEETRRKIKGEMKGVQATAKEAVENVGDTGREMLGDARDNIENIRENIAERVTRRKQSASR